MNYNTTALEGTGYNPSIINNYNNRGFTIEFEGSANIKDKIVFSAMLKSFVDDYTTEWSTENVFGFLDQIHIFKQTRRKINFSIDIPNVDEVEAEINFTKIKKLGRALYPTYKMLEGYKIIDQPPLIRIKFSNLISETLESRSLFGKIDSISISPDIEQGFFDVAPGILYPKLMQLDITFDIIHTENPTVVSAETINNAKRTGTYRTPSQKSYESIIDTNRGLNLEKVLSPKNNNFNETYQNVFVYNESGNAVNQEDEIRVLTS